MTSEDFRDRQFKLSVNAGMNQRYHHDRESHWSVYDRVAKAVIGGLAAAGAFATGVTFARSGTGWDVVSLVIAVLAGIAGIVLNVLPFSDWVNRHTALFQRWTDYREDVDDLLHDLGDDVPADLVDRLRELEAKQHRICGTEPHGDELLIKKCYDTEYRSRVTETRPALVG